MRASTAVATRWTIGPISSASDAVELRHAEDMAFGFDDERSDAERADA
jgi:hypothetical protein